MRIDPRVSKKSRRRRILPRRERPEIAAIRDRLIARRVVRFMRRYTDIPAGKELSLTIELLGDICLARDLMFAAAARQFYRMQHDRNIILAIPHVTEPEKVELERALAELREFCGDTVVVTEELVRQLNDLLNQYAYEGFLERNLHIHDPETADDFRHRGHAKLEAGDFAGALSDYTIAIELGSVREMYLQSRANCYAQLHRYAEAACDLLEAEKLCLARGDLLDLCCCRAELCKAWTRLGSVHDLLIAADRFSHVAGYLTFNTEWSADGQGRYGSCEFPGARVAERLTEVLAQLQETVAGLVDRGQQLQGAAVAENIRALRSLY